ncbi:MAG: phosphoadenosine phosphosulfate reductase family protein [Clostridia bacterium]|nr:phosphoadenosine phosphosulfate reductase family protein [Clostridia bacterium]
MKNAVRQFGLPGYELGDYMKESIDFLRQHEPAEGYFVGFSGGKDSIVTLELCRIAGVKCFPYYSCTRIDPPEMYKFIKANYPEVQWLFPRESFWKLIYKKSPPMRHMRWCCDKLKKEPSKHIPLSKRVMGIRAEESARRASKPRIDKYNKKQYLVKPIFYWPEWAVWEFIEAYKLPYPSLYDEGLGRIGCVCCPFIFGVSENARRRIALYQKKWPGIWRCFELAVRKWFDEKGGKTLRIGQVCKTSDEFWKRYLGGVLR